MGKYQHNGDCCIVDDPHRVSDYIDELLEKINKRDQTIDALEKQLVEQYHQGFDDGILEGYHRGYEECAYDWRHK